MQRREGQSSLLPEVDRLRGVALLPGFDLNKNNPVAITTDQVNLALSSSVTTNQDFHPSATQKLGGDSFSTVTQPSTPDRPAEPAIEWIRFG